MKKTSKKNLRTKSSRKRTDHPAGCRVNDDELAAVRGDIDAIAQASGHKPSLGAYTKHALVSHQRYRRMEVQLRKLLSDEAIESYFAGEVQMGDPLHGKEFYDGVKQILENAR